MDHALDMGLSAEAFWRMSPRAVIMLMREMRRGMNAQADAASGKDRDTVRLYYIPRP